MEKPDIENCTEKKYEKWFWSDYNQKCKECANDCKQSHVVELLNCVQFKTAS